jgi:catechol 2,3-dioxygenase-like lactoylglutathione lyase family enzyme
VDVDHIVLWVENSKRSLAFYVDLLGLEAVRTKEFEEGKARFPSVRVNERTIFDLMERNELLPLVQDFTGGGDKIGGTPINHVCLSMTASEFASISARLAEHGVDVRPGGEDVFGAQGQAVRSVYFNDPDGNVLELRYYER